MRISVEGLLRPASPTRGPPFRAQQDYSGSLILPLNQAPKQSAGERQSTTGDQKLTTIEGHGFLTLILFQSGAEAKHVAIRMAQMKFAHAPGFIGGRHGHRQTVVQGQLMCGINVGR